MAHTAHRAWLPLGLLLVLLLALASAPRVYGQAGQSELSTKYFSIYYPAGEEKSARWYADFADNVDTEVSDLLGSAPVQGLVLRIYSTEAEYLQANPLAEIHPGILAHAIPERKEIGVAVERLRQQPPELARESFRHEMTHIVAGFISGQNLPVGFQEGLAQYNELSATRAEDVVKVLADAQNKGQSLLSWSELNDRPTFADRLDIAYPETYTVMAFLADHFGMGKYSVFLEGLRDGKTWPDALQSAYGESLDQLQSEWQDYLPGFFTDGWQQNLLSAYDMAPAIALYDAGHFAEAVQSFTRSEKLYSDLGKQAKASEAATRLASARTAAAARETADSASRAVAGHDYATAWTQALEAYRAFGGINLIGQQKYAHDVLGMAAQGMAASATLDRIRGSLHLVDYSQAQSDLTQAGQTLATLGDTGGVDEANSLMQQMWFIQRLAGVFVLGGGAFIATLGVLFSVFRSSRNRPADKLVREENAPWL